MKESKVQFVERMKQAKAKQAHLKIVPASPPQEVLDSWKAHDESHLATAIQKLLHPDGDSFEIGIVDGELVSLAIKQGPHEICKLALTYDETGILIGALQRARRKVQP